MIMLAGRGLAERGGRTTSERPSNIGEPEICTIRVTVRIFLRRTPGERIWVGTRESRYRQTIHGKERVEYGLCEQLCDTWR
jgi:hypothetical protein